MILYLRRGQSTVSRNNSQVLGLMVDVRGCGWLWKLRELCWMAGIGMDYFRALVIDEEDSPDIFSWLSWECAEEPGIERGSVVTRGRIRMLWLYLIDTLVFTVGLVWGKEVVECTLNLLYTVLKFQADLLTLQPFTALSIPYINQYTNVVCYDVVNVCWLLLGGLLGTRSNTVRSFLYNTSIVQRQSLISYYYLLPLRAREILSNSESS